MNIPIKNSWIDSRYYILLLLIGLVACKKLVDVPAPVTSINSVNVYASDATAIAVLTGIYANMASPNRSFTGTQSISLDAGLSADEFTLYSGIPTTDNKYYYYTNTLFASEFNAPGSEKWSDLYNFIFVCNAAIEGLGQSTSLTPAVRQQLLGEAEFIRAFDYFYLVNLYGDVPLILGTDYTVNESMSRTPAVQVYNQIITDLTDAQGLLTDSYLDATLLNTTPDRVRPNKWAATALLARVDLYAGKYADAENQASAVIANSALYSLCNLDSVFYKNSPEAIWQIEPSYFQHNTEDAWLFILPSTGPSSSYPVYLSAGLLNSFEPGDRRRVIGNWIDSLSVSGNTYYYPYKYKSAILNAPLTEYLMVLRLGEQYLIRAEARAEQGNTNGAQADLNAVRVRAGLGNTPASDPSSLLAAIYHERQTELFTEWGHRWLDLKRTGEIDTVMEKACLAKGSSWQTYQQLFPLPFLDVSEDPNLVQNMGY